MCDLDVIYNIFLILRSLRIFRIFSVYNNYHGSLVNYKNERYSKIVFNILCFLFISSGIFLAF
jgi:hypothetical protein